MALVSPLLSYLPPFLSEWPSVDRTFLAGSWIRIEPAVSRYEVGECMGANLDTGQRSAISYELGHNQIAHSKVVQMSAILNNNGMVHPYEIDNKTPLIEPKLFFDDDQ